MKLFVNITIDGKPLTIFLKSSISNLWDQGSEYASGVSKVKCNLKVKFTFYSKVQRKGSTYAKMKKRKYCKKGTLSCKSIWKIVWLNSWNNRSDMFQKIAVIKFTGKHACWRPLLPRCATCSPVTLLKTNSITDISLRIFWN